MDVAYVSRFVDLDVVTPCCATATTLNDLAYDWPMGFARWELVAESPGRPQLTDTEMAEIEDALGHRLRQIWQHI